MTAVSAQTLPPTSSPGSPIRRRPMPLENLSTDTAEESSTRSTISHSTESARYGLPPASPVRVNYQSENWAKPSNANIENSPGSAVSDPNALEAPPPPLHAPQTNRPERSVYTASMTSNSRQPGDGLAPSPRVRVVPQHDVDGRRPVSSGTGADGVPANGIVPPGSSGHNRGSRGTNATSSTSQLQASAESSTTTSASSVSGINTNEMPDSADLSLEENSFGDDIPEPPAVPQLQYHHQPFLPQPASMPAVADPEQLDNRRPLSNPDILGRDSPVNRHLSPNSYIRRSSMPRPSSVYSDTIPRGGSPGSYGSSPARGSVSNPRHSPDGRPASYAEMLNVPYPQPAPAPITLDNAQLRSAVGNNASLLSTQKTLEMYRQNVKKTTDMSTQYSFAVFLISTAQEQGLSFDEESPKRKSQVENGGANPHELVREARSILQRLSNAGYPFAQYYLADGYASGLFSKGKEDYNAAFPLFVLAAKHGHAESAYRTALCYEFGWGCRKDPTKAIQYLRTASSKRHPGAMTRLGKACLSGDLGEKRYREGVKWLKLATESADAMYNAAPYQLGCMYETGYGDDIFKDESYAAELFTQAAELGNSDASFRMGDAYEYGKLNCPRDPALSVHFYTGAAERGHPAAMMGLCAWYLVGAPPLLEKDEEEAYEWARRSADLGYAKAQYAVGYFTETGIGCRRDMLEANVWYVKAADAGEERAKQRLKAIHAAANGGMPVDSTSAHHNKVRKSGSKDENCVIM